MINFFRNLLRSARGATAVEYGLILAVIVVVAMIAFVRLASTVIALWERIAFNVLAH